MPRSRSGITWEHDRHDMKKLVENVSMVTRFDGADAVRLHRHTFAGQLLLGKVV
jgi:hypothetical protein